MERPQTDLGWWLANWQVIAGLGLWFLSLVNSILPLVIVQRRLPGRPLAEFKTSKVDPSWLQWGYLLAYVATGLGVFGGMFWGISLTQKMPMESGFYLAGAVFSLFPVCAGLMALWTGFYRGMTGNGFSGDYYQVRGSQLSWLPGVQCLIGLCTATISLAGFLNARA